MRRKTKRQAESKRTVLHVAAVMGQNGILRSMRRRGDWAAFVSNDEEDAIVRAMMAKAEWEADAVRLNGPYDVYVGTLTKKVAAPKPTYSLEAL